MLVRMLEWSSLRGFSFFEKPVSIAIQMAAVPNFRSVFADAIVSFKQDRARTAPDCMPWHIYDRHNPNKGQIVFNVTPGSIAR